MAPVFDGLFTPLSPPWLVGFTVDDGEPGRVEEVLDSEMVEGTGATVSGRSPAALAATGSNWSPI